MARPRKNNADYFSHDAMMRNDTKILALRTKYKHEGYAVWNMFLEVLTEADNFKIELSKLELELLAGDFRIDVNKLKEIIDYLVDIELLTNNYDTQVYYSKNLIKRLEPVVEKRNRARQQSNRQVRQKDGTFGSFKDNNTDTSVVSVTETPQSKVKESKVNIYGDKSQFTLNGKTMSYQELNDDEVVYEDLDNATPKKYLNRKKAYAKVALYYLGLKGESGDVLRYYKDLKELFDRALEEVSEKEVEKEVKGRILVVKTYYEKKGMDWSLSAVVKNWNKIRKEYYPEVKELVNFKNL